jgi:two-component system response regulator QseB
MRILLVEDDDLIGDAIKNGLEQDKYTVDWVRDGNSAILAMKNEIFDLVVLDIGLPQRSGLEVLKEVRGSGNVTPVLVLTARDTVSDRIAGLDSGADDYLAKPFDMDELVARIRALLRRSRGRAHPILTHGDISLDPAAHQVTRADEVVELSGREFAILQVLMEYHGKVMSKSRLEEELYGWSSDVESNTVEVYIHHLRKKLGSDLIRTIRGVGYMIDKPK